MAGGVGGDGSYSGGSTPRRRRGTAALRCRCAHRGTPRPGCGCSARPCRCGVGCGGGSSGGARPGSDGRGEGLGAVARPVVGDHPYESDDAVGGQEGPGAAEEADRGGGLLVIRGLGVGRAGGAVDGGVQVGVAGSGFFVPPGGLGLGVGRVRGPASRLSVGCVRLLMSRWIMRPVEAGQDGFAGPVGLPGGVGCRVGGSGWLCPASGSRYVPTPLSRAGRARG